jgi:hypothetical protein
MYCTPSRCRAQQWAVTLTPQGIWDAGIMGSHIDKDKHFLKTLQMQIRGTRRP